MNTDNCYTTILNNNEKDINDNNYSDEIRPNQTDYHVRMVGEWTKVRSRTVVLKTQLHKRLLIKTISALIYCAVVSRCNGGPGHAPPHVRLRSPG